MLRVKKLLINQYHLQELGYDFMGYSLQKNDIYTYHHLIISARAGGATSVENGAILCEKTSHEYLHLIEKSERDIFVAITNEMINMKKKGHLDLYNLKVIHDLLCLYEYEHGEDENEFGILTIKPKYKIRLFKTEVL